MENQKCVQMGIPVIVEFDGGVKREITVVEANMANPLQGRVSADAPVGQAILGNEVGAKVTVKLPNRTMQCNILSFA